MTKLRMLALACGVALAVGPLAPVAPAQGKAPPADNNAGSYRFAAGDETLTSGDLVSINRKGAGKVTGVFVYSDPKSGKLYVRPKAGQPPVAVPANDIEKIERIRPAMTTGGKGGVKPAIDTGEKPAPKYEIHTLTVHNGPQATTFFYEDSLSPAERNQVNALERARANVLQKRAAVESLSQAIENAANTPSVTVVDNSMPNLGYGYYAYYSMYGLYGYPFTMNYPLYNEPGIGFGIANYGYPMWYYPGIMGGGGSNVVVQNSGSNPQNVAALTKALTEAETALAEARKNYVAISQRAIYDNSGHIVAVRLAE